MAFCGLVWLYMALYGHELFLEALIGLVWRYDGLNIAMV